MADTKTFNAEEFLSQQQADIKEKQENRKKKADKPTEFVVEQSPLPVLPTQGRAPKEGSAFEPSRSNLPPNVFGYRPSNRNPADIIEEKEERKNH